MNTLKIKTQFDYLSRITVEKLTLVMELLNLIRDE